TISQAEFVPYLAGRLAHFGIAPTRLEIEITEEAALDNRSQLLDTMQALQAMGCQVAMDDFGAGFASFPHLMKYPFDKVKLDRSLLLDCTAPKGRELYRLLVQIGQLAPCQVVAEGVETEQELAFVSECGVDRVQGFLIARPQPLEAVSAFLRATESDLP
ncbi:MAG: EAL domain-containing protein, partial [Plesiomonas shigelloides]